MLHLHRRDDYAAIYQTRAENIETVQHLQRAGKVCHVSTVAPARTPYSNILKESLVN